MSAPSIRLRSVVLDAARPWALARFYGRLLERPVVRADAGWYDLDLGDGLTLSVQHAPGHRAPTWPSWEVPQQLHLDLAVDDLETAERRALAAGARPAHGSEDDAHGAGFRVFLDPAGHPFCLCAC